MANETTTNLVDIFTDCEGSPKILSEVISDADPISTDPMMVKADQVDPDYYKKYVVSFDHLNTVEDATPILSGFGGFPLIYNGASFTVITASSGVGKTSFLVLALFGSEEARNKKILWFDTEQPEPALKRVVKQISEQRGCRIEDIKNVVLCSLRGANADEFERSVKTAVDAIHPDFMVMDNLADAIKDGTNDIDIREFLQSRIFPIMDANGVGLFGVLHKNRKNEIMGHPGTISFQKADIVIGIEKHPTDPLKRIIKHEKHRYNLEEDRVVKFNRDRGIMEWVTEPSEDFSEVLPVDRKDFVKAFIHEKYAVSERTIRKRFDEWQKQCDHYHKPISDEQWQIVFHELFGNGWIKERGKNGGAITYVKGDGI